MEEVLFCPALCMMPKQSLSFTPVTGAEMVPVSSNSSSIESPEFEVDRGLQLL